MSRVDAVDVLVDELFNDDEIEGFMPSGLRLYKTWMSEAGQQAVLEALNLEGWFDDTNQGMHFGRLPDWAQTWIADSFPQDAYPPEVMNRSPLFDQLILNRYQPGDGIKDHVDLLRFEDGIAILSLGSSAVMHVTHVADPSRTHEVLLEPGDLLTLCGEARYEWTHGIRNLTQEVHEPSGRVVVRGVRTSVTLRRLRPDVVLCEPA